MPCCGHPVGYRTKEGNPAPPTGSSGSPAEDGPASRGRNGRPTAAPSIPAVWQMPAIKMTPAELPLSTGRDRSRSLFPGAIAGFRSQQRHEHRPERELPSLRSFGKFA